MAQIETGDILRLGCSMLFNNLFEVTNVWHVLVSAGGPRTFLDSVADIQEYCDLLMEDIDTELVDNMTADRISVSNETQSLVFGAIDWGAFAQGGDAGDPTALGVCVLSWARTYVPRVQIRKYLGVFSEARMTDGQWLAALTNACHAQMANHISLFEGTLGLDLLGVAYNRTLGTFTLGQSTAVATEPSYQRRRRRGRGS